MLSSSSLMGKVMKLSGCLAAVLVILLALPIGQAAWMEALGVSGSVNTGAWTTPTPTPGPLPVTMKITPQSLQKCSQGNPVNARFDMDLRGDEDINSVRLCRGSGPCGDGGVPAANIKIVGKDLTATFDRAAVVALVADVPSDTEVTFTVSGMIGTQQFSGSDVIKVLDCKSSRSIEEDLMATTPGVETPSPAATDTPTVEPAPEATVTAEPTVEAPSTTPIADPTPEGDPTVAATPTAKPTDEPASPTPVPTATEPPAAVEPEPTPTEATGGAS
jgi:hypothetical protein